MDVLVLVADVAPPVSAPIDGAPDVLVALAAPPVAVNVAVPEVFEPLEVAAPPVPVPELLEPPVVAPPVAVPDVAVRLAAPPV